MRWQRTSHKHIGSLGPIPGSGLCFFFVLAQQPQDPKCHTVSRALCWSMSSKESQHHKIWCPDSSGLPCPRALAKPGVRNLTKQSGGGALGDQPRNTQILTWETVSRKSGFELGFRLVSDGFQMGFRWVSENLSDGFPMGFRMGFTWVSHGFQMPRWVSDGF